MWADYSSESGGRIAAKGGRDVIAAEVVTDDDAELLPWSIRA